MKKIYIQPEVNIVRLHGEQMLAASGSIKSVNNDIGIDIGFGGIDEEGSIEADVKGEGDFDFSWE